MRNQQHISFLEVNGASEIHVIWDGTLWGKSFARFEQAVSAAKGFGYLTEAEATAVLQGKLQLPLWSKEDIQTSTQLLVLQGFQPIGKL